MENRTQRRWTVLLRQRSSHFQTQRKTGNDEDDDADDDDDDDDVDVDDDDDNNDDDDDELAHWKMSFHSTDF